MKTTKSYLAGLGMTGIVIASILSLLVVGTGLVAFDGSPEPSGSNGPLERVVVGDEAHKPGAAGRRAGKDDSAPSPLAAAEPHRLGFRRVLVGRTGGAGGRQAGRRGQRRRSDRHGGVAVTADALGGGARAGGGTGSLRGGRAGSPVRERAGGGDGNGGEAPGGGDGGAAEPHSSPPPSGGRDSHRALGGGLPAPIEGAREDAQGLLPPDLRR
jgi:hypothetical protein